MDKDTGFYYYGARYYSANYGRFLSQDNVFLAIGENNGVLKDPQALDSYAYARNNPLRFVDPDGNFFKGFDFIKLPMMMGIKMTWGYGSVAAMIASRPATGILLAHSLINGGNLSINENNQKKYGNIINQIRDSNKYQKVRNGASSLAESKGYDQYTNTSLGVVFGLNSDLGTAIHKATISNFTAERGSDGTWNTNVTMTDTYNYEVGTYGGTFQEKLLGTLNNGAVASQQVGAIKKYDISLNFSDKVKIKE